jgi:hypothetical protein
MVEHLKNIDGVDDDDDRWSGLVWSGLVCQWSNRKI